MERAFNTIIYKNCTHFACFWVSAGRDGWPNGKTQRKLGKFPIKDTLQMSDNKTSLPSNWLWNHNGDYSSTSNSPKGICYPFGIQLQSLSGKVCRIELSFIKTLHTWLRAEESSMFWERECHHPSHPHALDRSWFDAFLIHAMPSSNPSSILNREVLTLSIYNISKGFRPD